MSVLVLLVVLALVLAVCSLIPQANAWPLLAVAVLLLSLSLLVGKL